MAAGGSAEKPEGELVVQLYEGAIGPTRLSQAQVSTCFHKADAFIGFVLAFLANTAKRIDLLIVKHPKKPAYTTYWVSAPAMLVPSSPLVSSFIGAWHGNFVTLCVSSTA